MKAWAAFTRAMPVVFFAWLCMALGLAFCLIDGFAESVVFGFGFVICAGKLAIAVSRLKGAE